MTHEVIPDVAGLPRNIEYQLTEYGGHVGFVGGTLKNRTCGWNIAFRPGFPLSGHPDVIIPWQELATDTLNSLIDPLYCAKAPITANKNARWNRRWRTCAAS